MSAASVVTPFFNGNDAEFRAWGKAISDRLAAGGFVKTADTGQIDWATVNVPASADTVAGYEIWRSDDAAGSLVNFYFKIEYGSGFTSFIRPGIWLTVGWGSNGSGGITGTTTGRLTGRMGGTPNNTGGHVQNLAAGNNWVCMLLKGAVTSQFAIISIERLRNTALQPTNELHILFEVSGDGTRNYVLTPTKLYSDAGSSGFLIQAAGRAIHDGVVGLGICMPEKAGYQSPVSNVFGVNAGQLGVDQSIVSITSYGQARNYIVNSTVGGLTSHSFKAGSAAQWLTRFE